MEKQQQQINEEKEEEHHEEWSLDPHVLQLQAECKLRLENVINMGGILLTIISISIVGIVWGSLSVRGIFDIASLATAALFAYSTIVFYTALNKSYGVMTRTIIFRCGFIGLAFIATALFSAFQTYTIASSCTLLPIPSGLELICTNGWGLLLASVIVGWTSFLLLIVSSILEFRVSSKVTDLAKYILDVYNYSGAENDPNILVTGRWEKLKPETQQQQQKPAAAHSDYISNNNNNNINIGKRKNV